MKIRNGFVSNSSSSSFCIYGWTEDVFKDRPDLLDNKYGSYKYELIDKLLKTIPHELSITVKGNTPSNDFVIGVGTMEYDIDHYMDDWEDYQSKGPTKEEMEKLEKIAEELKLPKPKIYSATWRDG